MSMATLTAPLAQLRSAGPPTPSRRPMILHVRVVAGSGGGPDKNILRSARYMRHSRYDVAAAYIHPHGDPGMQVLAEQAQAWGCPLYQIEEAGPMDPHSVRSLLQLCRKLRVAVWHAHDYKSNVLGLLLRSLWPMKLVTSVHGWTRETARTRFYYHVDRLCLNRFDHVIAVSPPLVEACLAAGVNLEQLTYLPNAVDLEEFPLRQGTATARRELRLSDDRLIIGTVGRLSSEKGVDRAVQTIAQLRRQRTDVELHLVGDGPERARLQELAGRLKVQDAVRFWGWQSHLQNFYGAMDLLLLPSHTEGFPNVVLEAMATGIPVAATNVGGISEMLDGGRCGLILGQEPDQWLDRIEALLDAQWLREDFARLGRRRVENRYSAQPWMSRITAIYDRLLHIPPAIQPLRRAA